MKVLVFSEEDEKLLHSVLDNEVLDLDNFIEPYYDIHGNLEVNDNDKAQHIKRSEKRRSAVQNLDYRISNAPVVK